MSRNIKNVYASQTCLGISNIKKCLQISKNVYKYLKMSISKKNV